MPIRPSRAGDDPFPPTADPSAYVPRTATESVLLQLEMAMDDGARVLLLEGAQGSGRTLLLHVLARRLDRRLRPLYLPYPKLTPLELWQWLLDALDDPGASQPESALRVRLERDVALGHPPGLLMVDDADWMPPATSERLLALQGDHPEALRSLWVVPEGYSGEHIQRTGLAIHRVRLEGAMDAEETEHYVRARLQRSAFDPQRRRRVEESIEMLYRQSAGNPGRLHAAASLLLLRSQLDSESRTASRGIRPAQA